VIQQGQDYGNRGVPAGGSRCQEAPGEDIEDFMCAAVQLSEKRVDS
jgi:hypothetical protein